MKRRDYPTLHLDINYGKEQHLLLQPSFKCFLKIICFKISLAHTNKNSTAYITNVSWDIFHKREESFTSEVLDNY
jgi:hypothetical protein